MNELIAALIILCYSFAAGIFYVLSCLEKPTWSLMWEESSPDVTDEDARFVHRALQRLIPLLPPTMVTTMIAGIVLLFVQCRAREFDSASVTVLVFLLVMVAYLFSRLHSRIRGVAGVPHDGDISRVRSGVGRLAALHHTGLFTVIGVIVLEFVLVIAR